MVIIDPGLDFADCLDTIKGYTVLAILITHGHLDHIDGIGLVDAPVYIGKNDFLNLTDLTLSLYSLMDLKPTFDFKKLKIITVNDNDNIELDGFKFKAIELPGHTRGSVGYLFYNNLFSGDTLFKGSVGRTDLPGGDNNKLNSSLKKIVSLLNDNTIIYPGHDEITSLKEEKKGNPFLRKLF